MWACYNYNVPTKTLGDCGTNDKDYSEIFIDLNLCVTAKHAHIR
jgi:hypothetical protein